MKKSEQVLFRKTHRPVAKGTTSIRGRGLGYPLPTGQIGGLPSSKEEIKTLWYLAGGLVLGGVLVEFLFKDSDDI